jgi:hypothetical protein
MNGWRGFKPLGVSTAATADDVKRAAETFKTERALQAEIAEALALALPADCYWTAIPGGDGRETRAPGYRSGTPDLIFVYRGKILFVELKRPRGGRASDAQREAHQAIERAGGLVYMARSLDLVVSLIRDELQCPVNLRL